MLFTELAIIGTILLVIGTIVVVTLRSSPRRQAARQPAPVAATPPAAAVKQPKRHLIVDPTTTFESLAGSLRRTGFQIHEPRTGEPREASWDAGRGTVHYTHDPELGLRLLEVKAPPDACRGIMNAIVNEDAYVATISYQLPDMLDPGKPVKDILFGLRGAEWIGRGDDHSFYWQKVGKLRDHADPTVAAEARRVYDALIAEAGGTPVPSGPASLPIVWTRSGADHVAKFRGNTWTYKPDGTVMIDGKPLDGKITEWPVRWTRA